MRFATILLLSYLIKDLDRVGDLNRKMPGFLLCQALKV